MKITRGWRAKEKTSESPARVQYQRISKAFPGACLLWFFPSKSCETKLLSRNSYLLLCLSWCLLRCVQAGSCAPFYIRCFVVIGQSLCLRAHRVRRQVTLMPGRGDCKQACRQESAPRRARSGDRCQK